jgi:hypothetical protein
MAWVQRQAVIVGEVSYSITDHATRHAHGGIVVSARQIDT